MISFQSILILAHGDAPSKELAHSEVLDHDFFIAVDGAAHVAKTLGLQPDLICGDFDSLFLEQAISEFPDSVILPTPDQNFADLEKAIRLALEYRPDKITLMGTLGGRLDHTLGNLALIGRYAEESRLSIKDDSCVCLALSGNSERSATFLIDTKPGDTLSLITFQEGAVVSVEGVRWELQDHPLVIGTHGVSNLATGSQVRVTVLNGVVYVCHLQCKSETSWNDSPS